MPGEISISIHALLAESDVSITITITCIASFLSTLSLRRATNGFAGVLFLIDDFYPRSPCGERPLYGCYSLRHSAYFYPRSPCGERRKPRRLKSRRCVFLSTLSLRRATQTETLKVSALCISIHALLAESDRFRAIQHPKINISIHALLAESDGLQPLIASLT